MFLLVLLLCNLDVVLGFNPTLSVWRRSSNALSQHRSLPTPIDTLTSGLASICRLPKGVTATTTTTTTPLPTLKVLYDVENSPDCRRVREIITELDLTVDLVIPAAKNSRVFADSTFPYYLPPGSVVPRLVVEDDGNKETLSGSDKIMTYLKQYRPISPSEEASSNSLESETTVQQLGNSLASLLRISRGESVCSAATVDAPQRPLILYSYEGNQFCRLVREVLTELDIPYELRNAGKGSPRRNEIAETSGSSSTQCPFLIDPNTGVKMFESADIVRYLYKEYAKWTPPNELLRWASDTIVSIAKPIFVLTTPLLAGSKNAEVNYDKILDEAKKDVMSTTKSVPVVVYTYDWSPFSSETVTLLDGLGVQYKQVSLGKEWIPGLINEGASLTRAALLDLTGQSSLPHVFINGESIGGLFSGTPGLVPLLEQGTLMSKIETAQKSFVDAA